MRVYINFANTPLTRVNIELLLKPRLNKRIRIVPLFINDARKFRCEIPASACKPKLH